MGGMGDPIDESPFGMKRATAEAEAAAKKANTLTITITIDLSTGKSKLEAPLHQPSWIMYMMRWANKKLDDHYFGEKDQSMILSPH